MRAIYTYMRCIEVTTDYWDIRLSGTTRQIYTIKLALESTHQIVFNDIFIHYIEISIYKDTSISM